MGGQKKGVGGQKRRLHLQRKGRPVNLIGEKKKGGWTKKGRWVDKKRDMGGQHKGGGWIKKGRWVTK